MVKTFKQFLKEANNSKFPPENIRKEFQKAIINIRDIANLEYDMWDKIYEDIENNKFKDSTYFKDYDKEMQIVDKTVHNYPYGTAYSISEVNELKANYEKAKTNFNIDAKAFNLVKVGDSQEEAIKKLVKGLKDKDIAKRYDPLGEDDILYQIKKFDGSVKINGGNDIYLKFKNGKVISKFF